MLEIRSPTGTQCMYIRIIHVINILFVWVAFLIWKSCLGSGVLASYFRVSTAKQTWFVTWCLFLFMQNKYKDGILLRDPGVVRQTFSLLEQW